GCWPARLGLADVGLLPSGPWQAAQTVLTIFSPAARSGLALSCAIPTAGIIEAATPRAAAAKNRATGEVLEDASVCVGMLSMLWDIANPVCSGFHRRTGRQVREIRRASCRGGRQRA